MKRKELDTRLVVLFQDRKYEDILKIAKKALLKDSGYIYGWKAMGTVYYLKKEYESALYHFKKALELNPDDLTLCLNLGSLSKDIGNLDDAEYYYRKAIELKPDFAGVYNNLGNILKDNGKLEESEQCYYKAIELKSDYTEAYNNLGVLFKETAQVKKIEHCYRKALALDPNYAEVYGNLGNFLSDSGKVEEAKSCYFKALELNPDLMEVYFRLSLLIKYKKDSFHLKQLHDRYKRINDRSKQYYLEFGLAKAYEDIQDYDRSFKYLRQANQSKNDKVKYDIKDDIKLFHTLKTIFQGEDIKSVQKDITYDKQPIFIVGMPRSGTSLSEQILSSHSNVFGCGELEYLHIFFNRYLLFDMDNSSFSLKKSLKKIYKEYMQKIKKLDFQEKIFIDKMPHNFRYIGIILEAFPNAKIIHIKREPIAVCWSLYKNHFSTNGLGFSYSFQTLVKFYTMYENLMKFWNQRYPKKIYDLQYETLIENQEPETKKLLKYCGLPWEKGVLEPHKNKRPVFTASNHQVRKKVYKGSNEAWKKYEKYLKPLSEELSRVSYNN